MSGTVTADNGVQLPLSDLAQTIAYDGVLVASVTVEYRNLTYIQSFTNNGTSITSTTPFEVQP